MVSLLAGIAALIAGLVVLGADGSSAVGGVLVGSGLVLAVDGLRELRAAGEKQRQDLDETRRVLYMAYGYAAMNLNGTAEAAGTAANALAHHAHANSISLDEALFMVQQILSPGQARDDLRQEIADRIRAITKQLDRRGRMALPSWLDCRGHGR